jgi:hypothetical protein
MYRAPEAVSPAAPSALASQMIDGIDRLAETLSRQLRNLVEQRALLTFHQFLDCRHRIYPLQGVFALDRGQI